MDQFFIPECYVDTNLIETLVPPTKQYNHQKGCGTVTKVMKNNFADRFAVGIIDKDKREVDYLNEFVEKYNDGSLLLHKHKSRHHYIIQISPAMERFILSNAEVIGVNIEEFDLSPELDILKKEAKTVNSKNDQRFKRLFKTLTNQGAPGLLRLKAWINYLKDKTYNTDIDELIRL